MTNETLARLQQMSREQKEGRYQALLQRMNIAPVMDTLPRGGPRSEIPLEEMEEYEWLRNQFKQIGSWS
jgi:hypothetical protein